MVCAGVLIAQPACPKTPLIEGLKYIAAINAPAGDNMVVADIAWQKRYGLFVDNSSV
jgi:hypothetical protein